MILFFPPSISPYIEPFSGGGAVLFHLWNTRRLDGEILLFDNNAELINVYNEAKNHPEALRTASQALQRATVEARDFRSIIDKAAPGDFFYLDPPYNPLNRAANFTGYTASSFTETDQRGLAKVFKLLSGKQCKCMLSSSYTPFITNLCGDFRIGMVFANRPINSVGHSRGRINEVLILNY